MVVRAPTMEISILSFSWQSCCFGPRKRIQKKNSSMYTHIKKFVSADFLGITYLLVQNKFSCVQYIFISFKAKRLFDLILIENFCISYQAYNNPRIRRLSNTNCMIDHLFDICSYIPCHYLYIELLKSQITNCHMQ